MKTTCLYCTPEQFNEFKKGYFIEQAIIPFPENGLLFEQVRHLPRYEGYFVATTNPLVCTNYKKGEVFTLVGGILEELYSNVYGASLDYICKVLDNDTKAVLTHHIVTEIRDHLAISDESALEYLETLSNSAEKAYLKTKLLKDRKS